MALRERVVAFVQEGHCNREASRHFRVSPRFVNDLMNLHRNAGSLPQNRKGGLAAAASLPIIMSGYASAWRRTAT
jgi:transposase